MKKNKLSILTNTINIITLPIFSAILISPFSAYSAPAFTYSGDVFPTPPAPGTTVWNTGADLEIGDSGTNGSLTVSDGASINASNILAGQDLGLVGNLFVDGAGSKVTFNTASNVLGWNGTGIVTLTNGGQVVTSGGAATAIGVQLGVNANSKGIINIDGAGSEWSSSHSLTLGLNGSGDVNITNGGRMDVGGMIIGNRQTALGKIIVSGPGSSLNSNGNVYVGYLGTAVLTVSDGGAVNINTIYLAAGNVSKGTLNIGGDYGSAAKDAGTVNAQKIVFGTGDATLNLNTTNSTKIGAILEGQGQGQGNINQLSGRTILTGNSNSFSGNVNISGGTLQLGDNSDSGIIASDINTGDNASKSGTLAFSRSNDVVFNKVISGAGNLSKESSGVLYLSGKNTYTGITTINSGTLFQSSEGALSSASDYSVNSNGTLDIGGYNTTLKSLVNNGTVNLSNNSSSVLTVSGDYKGNNGLLIFASILGNDASETDKLVVKGNTAGTTRVAVNNLGGSGAKTLNGIELISVGGQSAGEFKQSGRIVAGAYDYNLIRGTGDRAGNWYITNQAPPAVPPAVVPPAVVPPAVVPPAVVPPAVVPPAVVPPSVVPPAPHPVESTIRPEAGAYINNLAIANNMFDLSLDDHSAKTEYTDIVTGEKKLTSMWLLTSGGHNRSKDSSGQLSIQANRYAMMIGGDVATGIGYAESTWNLGLLAGYGNNHSTTTSRITNYHAKGEVDGYTTGIYGTWYDKGTDKNGLYLDTVLQYSWFNNTVSGENISPEKYHSKGVSTSVEGGYVIPMGIIANNDIYLRPNIKMRWSGIQANDSVETNGTRVSGTGENNLGSSVGVRIFSSPVSLNEHKQDAFEIKPFIETNWIHNTENYGAVLDGDEITQNGSKNIAEVKIGLDGNILPALSVGATVGQQYGSNNWSDTSGMVSVKYAF